MSCPINSELSVWASEHFDLGTCDIEQLPAEASTRKFWRCSTTSESWILMDSPPATENNEQFVTLSDVFRKAKVPVPQVIARDLSRGFLLVEDVGKHSYLSSYRRGSIAHPISTAVETILKIQSIDDPAIPPYTAGRLNDELHIFREFVCENLLGGVDQSFQHAVPFLVNEINQLPRVTVHRDFHCMNLLVRHQYPYIGVVDFQDALSGSLTYDLASLLFDCYWQHSLETVESALTQYLEGVEELSIPIKQNRDQFFNSIKLTAIQRLLKAAGIFVRLLINKHQTTHIHHVLPTLAKAQTLCSQLDPFHELATWLYEDVIPGVKLKLETAT
ncbi:MAG: phosphotransferase [Gammaproteobacteria bacterium]|nr:phosphotransferase [Gammaproteobacteria bacterium]